MNYQSGAMRGNPVAGRNKLIAIQKLNQKMQSQGGPGMLQQLQKQWAHPGATQGGQQGGGYTGLSGIMSALAGGVNQSQLHNMEQGANGADGMGIGGMHGAFAGLSPQAMHFLATSGLLEKQAAQHQAVTGADGQPLTGDDLFKANFMNTLADNNASTNPTYKLHSGVDQSFLEQALGGFGGPAYAKGFNADGRRGQNPGLPNRLHQGGGGGFFTPYGGRMGGIQGGGGGIHRILGQGGGRPGFGRMQGRPIRQQPL